MSPRFVPSLPLALAANPLYGRPWVGQHEWLRPLALEPGNQEAEDSVRQASLPRGAQ